MKRPMILIALGLTMTAQAQNTYTLQQCKEMALENNINISTGKNEIRMAEERKKEAFTKYFPEISATGGTFKSDDDLLKTSIKTADYVPAELASIIPAQILQMIPSSLTISALDEGTLIGAAAVQPVFAGGRIVNGNKLASLGVEASEIEYERTVNSVNLQTERYFWQIIALKEKLATVDTVLTSLESISKDVSGAVDAGVAMKNDLLQVELKQNEMLSNKMNAENGIAILKSLLRQYVGIEDEEFDVEAGTSMESNADRVFGLCGNHEDALERTPEYRLLEMDVKSKSLQYKMEVGNHLPSVGVGAGYSYIDVLNQDRGIGMVFASVSVPLSDWWGGSHALKRKKLETANAESRMRDSRELLLINMQNSWNSVDNAFRQLELSEKMISQSNENLRIQRDNYNAGTVTISDLLSAQMKCQQDRDTYVEAFSSLQMKILEYKIATGQKE